MRVISLLQRCNALSRRCFTGCLQVRKHYHVLEESSNKKCKINIFWGKTSTCESLVLIGIAISWGLVYHVVVLNKSYLWRKTSLILHQRFISYCITYLNTPCHTLNSFGTVIDSSYQCCHCVPWLMKWTMFCLHSSYNWIWELGSIQKDNIWKRWVGLRKKFSFLCFALLIENVVIDLAWIKYIFILQPSRKIFEKCCFIFVCCANNKKISFCCA